MRRRLGDHDPAVSPDRGCDGGHPVDRSEPALVVERCSCDRWQWTRHRTRVHPASLPCTAGPLGLQEGPSPLPPAAHVSAVTVARGTMIGHHPSRVTRTWADQAHWWIWAYLVRSFISGPVLPIVTDHVECDGRAESESGEDVRAVVGPDRWGTGVVQRVGQSDGVGGRHQGGQLVAVQPAEVVGLGSGREHSPSRMAAETSATTPRARFLYAPVSASGSMVKPVSSRTSRRSPSGIDSPSSSTPPGGSQRLFLRRCTTRTRSASTMAAATLTECRGGLRSCARPPSAPVL